MLRPQLTLLEPSKLSHDIRHDVACAIFTWPKRPVKAMIRV